MCAYVREQDTNIFLVSFEIDFALLFATCVLLFLLLQVRCIQPGYTVAVLPSCHACTLWTSCRELTFAGFAKVAFRAVTIYDGDVTQRFVVRPNHTARASILAWVGKAKFFGNYTARRRRNKRTKLLSDWSIEHGSICVNRTRKNKPFSVLFVYVLISNVNIQHVQSFNNCHISEVVRRKTETKISD